MARDGHAGKTGHLCGGHDFLRAARFKVVLAKAQRCRHAVHLCARRALSQRRSYKFHRAGGRVRGILCRTGAQQVYSKAVTADGKTGVYGKRHLHSVFPHRRGHAHQYQGAVRKLAHGKHRGLHGHHWHRGENDCGVCRRSGFQTAAEQRAHALRTDFGTRGRLHRHRHGGKTA